MDSEDYSKLEDFLVIAVGGLLLSILALLMTPVLDTYFAMVYGFVGDLSGFEMSDINKDFLATIFLSIITASMVVAIYLQVKAQERHLRAFDPSIVVEIFTRRVENKAANLEVLVQNISQTSTVITGVKLDNDSDLDCTIMDLENTKDNEGVSNTAKYYMSENEGKIPVEANKSIKLGIAIRSGSESEGLKNKERLDIKLEYLDANKDTKKETLSIDLTSDGKEDG